MIFPARSPWFRGPPRAWVKRPPSPWPRPAPASCSPIENLAGAEATAETIRALRRKIVVVGANVSDPDAIAELFRQVDAEFGRVDFLGNIAGDGHLAKPEDLRIEDLHRVLQNLVVGRFAMCQQAGRRMLAQGRGSIMNIGSLASSTWLGRGHVAYSMAMGAVVQMTRELSTEWSTAECE